MHYAQATAERKQLLTAVFTTVYCRLGNIVLNCILQGLIKRRKKSIARRQRSSVLTQHHSQQDPA